MLKSQILSLEQNPGLHQTIQIVIFSQLQGYSPFRQDREKDAMGEVFHFG